MTDELPRAVKEAARVLLEHAARASVPEMLEAPGDGRTVFIVRSGGLDQLGTLLERLAVLRPDARVTILGRRGDAAALPKLWSGPGACHEVDGDGPFEWASLAAAEGIRDAARACDTHLFLMRNSSATGYDNIQEIMAHVAGDTWYGVTPDGRFARFGAAPVEDLRASVRLRDAIIDWAAR